MIRGIYAKIFLWFCLASAVIGGLVVVITVAAHVQSLGPRWMTGVLDLYARTAVEIYERGGKEQLQEYLEEIERSSRMASTLLDPASRDITGRGIPPGAERVLADARAMRRSRFRTGILWTGASLVKTPKGDFVLVARVTPYSGLWTWNGLRAPVLRLGVALVSGALLCLVLARHIAAPIRTLQTVARRIADGDLSVRAAPSMSDRTDELADLARDFDRMAERIQALLEKQQELLGDISHELRSPLTRLSVSLELVRRGEREGVERMQADLDRLDFLIEQILTLTRLQAHSHQRIDTNVNLRSVLESVVEDACFEGSEQGKAAVLLGSDCWTKGDATLLRSCLDNIVRNAIHHTRPRTKVEISLNTQIRRGAAFASIVVADEGGGAPPESLSRLFDPFYRVSEALDHQSRGTGLGLSIAQRIAVLHGGSIVARNRERGGLEVEVCFPAVDARFVQSCAFISTVRQDV